MQTFVSHSAAQNNQGNVWDFKDDGFLEADFIFFTNSDAKCKGNHSEEWVSLLKNAFLPSRDALWCYKCLFEIYACDEPRQETRL